MYIYIYTIIVNQRERERDRERERERELMMVSCVYSSPGSLEYIIPRLVTSVLILPSIAIYTQVNLSCLFNLCIYIKVDDLQLYTPVTIHIRVAAITNGMIRY